MATRHPLVAAGYTLLGVGLVVEGVRAWMGKNGGGGGLLGRGPEAEAMQSAGGVIKTVRNIRVRNVEESVPYIRDRILKDSLKPLVREQALAVLTRKCGAAGNRRWCVSPKDWRAEVVALYRAMQDANEETALRYTRDHVEVDQFTAADKLLRLHAGDCFLSSSKVLRADGELVAISDVRVGDRIWGLDSWEEVVEVYETGNRPTWLFRLNNGSDVRMTPDNKVWVDDEEDGPIRIRAEQLTTADVLLRPTMVKLAAHPEEVMRRLVHEALREGELAHARVFAKALGITLGDSQGPHVRGAPRELRVVDIVRDDLVLPTRALETDQHHVWLPEADWTVSQCDDGTIQLGAMLRSVGYPLKMRVIQDRNSSTWSHIYLCVGLPPTGPREWLPLDWSVLPFKPAGWEAPGAAKVALNGKPAELVTRLKDFAV